MTASDATEEAPVTARIPTGATDTPRAKIESAAGAEPGA
jgi:hypothetical protein